MDCFVGSEGEWDLCSSILSLENQQLDFTSIPDAWFCSLDSFTANFNFGANSCDENYQFSNCIAAAADDHHHHNHIMSISGGAIQDQKEMESIFLQEISGFCGEDHKFVNMDYIQTHQGDDDANNNPANALHYKRKSTLLAHDDDHIPTKKIRTSTNVEKTRKATTQSNGKMRKQKLSSPRRKCEEEEEENGGCDMNRCSSTDNSSEDNDNASLQTGTVNLEGDVSPSKANTRATRGSATDPQSLYARKRRERINERLKHLQKLVPNGTKVDISTMLEEAVNYVKFLQLQIKLLSSDELWMYAPIAYNGMDIGVQHKLSSIL